MTDEKLNPFPNLWGDPTDVRLKIREWREESKARVQERYNHYWNHVDIDEKCGTRYPKYPVHDLLDFLKEVLEAL